jgi:hypothetical protein
MNKLQYLIELHCIILFYKKGHKLILESSSSDVTALVNQFLYASAAAACGGTVLIDKKSKVKSEHQT